MDTLDFIHSYARVFSGKQQSSLHVTTVQVAQPKPCTLTNNDSTHSSGRKVTNKQEGIFSSVTTQNQLFPITQETEAEEDRSGREFCCHRSEAPVTPPTLSIENFKLQTEGDMALKQLRKVSDNYISLKVASTTHDKPLADFQTYFSLSQKLPPVEQSNIIYYKVLAQRCDDNETLLSVINDLYEQFIVTKKQKFILLEGDQATYERLQSIKTEYGNDLSWLAPFPGDWHFLKNFQEKYTLMQVSMIWPRPVVTKPTPLVQISKELTIFYSKHGNLFIAC